MAKRTKKFKTEVQQLLDLVIHSLYSKKEIFLRELISNASDAIDRARFEALTDESRASEGEWRIKITADKEAGTLTISDNGVGMTAEELEKNIGTIANSGTRNFLAGLQDGAANPDFIGQFGVGFYSAFMVADQVEVLTKRAGSDEPATHWTSKGAGSYTLKDAEKAEPGTDIIVHVQDELKEFLEEWKIRQIVKEYSNYIEFPVVMDVTRTQPAEEEGGDPTTTIEEETLNSMKSIWKRSKSDITDDEYKEFYHHISHDYGDPREILHYQAEGVTEFTALLFLPKQAPFDLYFREERRGIHLYVKNVFITDDCRELVPDYLRFMKGVVDASDLPLNVSREMLQDDAVLRRINKSITGKCLNTFADMQKKRPDEYLSFFRDFGTVLKEGMHSSPEHKEKLQDLLLFPSTATEDHGLTTLKEYVERMPDTQPAVYYLTSDSLESGSSSPHLEVFRNKGYEVLLLVDSIDEWVVQSLSEYDGKALKPVDRGELEFSEDDKKVDEARREEAEKEFSGLLGLFRDNLSEDVKDVRFSNRLTDSPCCLVADEHSMNPNMERIMKAMKQDVPDSKRILELNPDHPLMNRLKDLHKDKSDQLDDFIELVYNQALLTEGSPVRNPVKFSQLVSELMVGASRS